MGLGQVFHDARMTTLKEKRGGYYGDSERKKILSVSKYKQLRICLLLIIDEC